MRLVGAIILAIGHRSVRPDGLSEAPPATNVPCGPSAAFVGITATQICWLHTHDTSAIIHLEAGDARTFTLADFFAVWRQPLGATVIDGERVGNGESVQVTVNRQPYTGAPETIVLSNHEDIVLQIGPPFVTLQPDVWPPGY
jgi:hypothetical protein